MSSFADWATQYTKGLDGGEQQALSSSPIPFTSNANSAPQDTLTTQQAPPPLPLPSFLMPFVSNDGTPAPIPFSSIGSQTRLDEVAPIPSRPPFSDSPISDAAQADKSGLTNIPYLGGLVSAAEAVGRGIGGAINGAWDKTRGDEVGAASIGNVWRSIPGFGLGEVGLEAISPDAKNYLQNTSIRDVPVLGSVVRAGEAIGGALNQTNQIIAEPAATGVALMREQIPQGIKDQIRNPIGGGVGIGGAFANVLSGVMGQDNPDLYQKMGTTTEEAGQLLRGFVSNTNTPEQNKHFEEMLHKGTESEAQVNPVAHLVTTAALDPLTWLDVGKVLPNIGEIQKLRRVWEASGDVTNVGEVLGKDASVLDKLIFKVLQPKALAEGELLAKETPKTGIIERLIRPFGDTPTSAIVDTIERVQGNLNPFLADTSRSFSDKLKLLGMMSQASKEGKLAPAALEFMGEQGIKNAADFHTGIHSILDYNPQKVIDEYTEAHRIYESLRQTTNTTRGAIYDAGVAGFAQTQAGGLSKPYANVFDRVIGAWKEGKLDLNELGKGIENIAGLRLSNDLTEHMAGALVKQAGIKAPNFVTKLIENMKALEGLAYIGGNPASMVSNFTGDVMNLTRHGVNVAQSSKDIEALFTRYGYTPSADISKLIREARGLSKETSSAFGTNVPSIVEKIPGLNWINQKFNDSQVWGRALAQATGMERFMTHNFKVPEFSPRIDGFLRSTFGDAEAAKIADGLRHARNYGEAENVLVKGAPSWTDYTEQIAAKLTKDLTELGGKPFEITPDMIPDALDPARKEMMRRVIAEAWEDTQNGMDSVAAIKKARAKITASDVAGQDFTDLFPNTETSAPVTPAPAERLPKDFGLTRAENVPNEALRAIVDKLPERVVSRAQMMNVFGDAKLADGTKIHPDDWGKVLDELSARGWLEETPGGYKPFKTATGATPLKEVPAANVTNPAVSSVVANVQKRAAAITQPAIDTSLMREWNALLHEGEAENIQRATQRAVNKMSPDVYLEKAQEWVARARGQGQTWMNQYADMMQDRAHFILDQQRNGNPKYLTDYWTNRAANGDALSRLLKGGQDGFDWTKLDQPYEYRPYESFAEYRKRITDTSIQRDFINGAGAGDTSVGAASSGTGGRDVGASVTNGASSGAEHVIPHDQMTVTQYVDDYLAGKGRGTTPQDLEYQQFAANHGAEIEKEFQARAGTNTAGNSVDQLKQVMDQAKAEGPSAATNGKLNQAGNDAIANLMLDAIEESMSTQGMRAAKVLPDDMAAEMQDWLKNVYMPAQNEAKQGANAAGNLFVDATTLNYDHRWNIDDGLLLAAPFTQWWLHTLVNYSKDFIDHPAALAFLVHVREMMDRQTEGMPDRFRGSIQMPMPLAEGLGLGDSIWIRPMRTVMPWEDVFQLSNIEKAGFNSVKEDGTTDYGNVFQDMFGIHTPYKMIHALLTGRGDDLKNIVSSIPAARLFKSATGIGFEGEYDKFYYERALKELVTEKKLTDEQAQIALLQQSGKDWDLVKQRANLENYTARDLSGLTGMRGMVFTPGEQHYIESQRARDKMLVDAVKRLGGNPNMPPDLRYQFLNSKDYYKSDEWQKFKTQYPELSTGTFIGKAYNDNGTRLTEPKAAEVRYNAWVGNKVTTAFYALPELQQKIAAQQLGPDFQKYFLGYDGAKDPTKITQPMMDSWANAFGVDLPIPANFDPATPDPAKVFWASDAQAKTYQAWYDSVNHDAVNPLLEQYFAIPETDAEARKAFADATPLLKQYWDSRSQMFDQNPDLVDLLMDDTEKKKFYISDLWDHYYALSDLDRTILRKQMDDGFKRDFISKPTRNYDAVGTDALTYWLSKIKHAEGFATPQQSAAYQQYNAAVEQKFGQDNIRAWTEKYFSIPSSDKAARKAYREQSGLLAYWQMKDAFFAQYPDIAKLTGDTQTGYSNSGGNGYNDKPYSWNYNPRNTYYGKTYGGTKRQPRLNVSYSSIFRQFGGTKTQPQFTRYKYEPPARFPRRIMPRQ